MQWSISSASARNTFFPLSDSSSSSISINHMHTYTMADNLLVNNSLYHVCYLHFPALTYTVLYSKRHFPPNGVRIFSNGGSIFPNGVRIFSNGVRIFPNGVRIFPNGGSIFPNGGSIFPNGVRI